MDVAVASLVLHGYGGVRKWASARLEVLSALNWQHEKFLYEVS